MPKKTPQVHKTSTGRSLTTADKKRVIEIWVTPDHDLAYLVTKEFYHNGRNKEVMDTRLTRDELDALVDILIDALTLFNDENK
jgi:hypothetical protein